MIAPSNSIPPDLIALEDVFTLIEAHGSEEGYECQIGDLEVFARLCWEQLTPEQRATVLTSPDWQELLEVLDPEH